MDLWIDKLEKSLFEKQNCSLFFAFSFKETDSFFNSKIDTNPKTNLLLWKNERVAKIIPYPDRDQSCHIAKCQATSSGDRPKNSLQMMATSIKF